MDLFLENFTKRRNRLEEFLTPFIHELIYITIQRNKKKKDICGAKSHMEGYVLKFSSSFYFVSDIFRCSVEADSKSWIIMDFTQT